jgi:hypothetical protein
MLEKNLQKNCIKICSTYNVLSVKVDSTSTRGWPDLTLVLPNGKVLFVELKTPTGVLSKLQNRMLEKLKRNKANVYIIRSSAEFAELITSHLAD